MGAKTNAKSDKTFKEHLESQNLIPDNLLKDCCKNASYISAPQSIFR